MQRNKKGLWGGEGVMLALRGVSERLKDTSHEWTHFSRFYEDPHSQAIDYAQYEKKTWIVIDDTRRKEQLPPSQVTEKDQLMDNRMKGSNSKWRLAGLGH